MRTILSKFVFPVEEEKKRSLYYRVQGYVETVQEQLHLGPNAVVQFDTYFNGFFYAKYESYTVLDAVAFCLDISGKGYAELICKDYTGRERVLETISVSGERREIRFLPVLFQTLLQNGMLFCRVIAESGVVLYGGWAETTQTPENKVKVAVVICTYHRETYVYQNLDRLRSLWGKATCPAAENVDVFVIDNGQSIVLEKEAHIQLYRNRNLGGSGGFTRGLIEAMRKGSAYTHVLFMDDDISFETESLVRTIQLLKYTRMRPRPLCIGGQMLLEHAPTIQHEAGAYFRRGRVRRINSGLDLADWRTLLVNDQERHPQYNAWWYCCIPIDAIKRVGLPLPFFIKMDDIEYGIRLDADFLLLNGIGVWHQSFGNKYSPQIEYWHKRNILVMDAIHDREGGVIGSLWILVLGCGKALLNGDGRALVFLYRAFDDFLRGPDFFVYMNEEQLNETLRAMCLALPKTGRVRMLASVMVHFVKYSILYLKQYRKVKKDYQMNWTQFTTLAYWCKHLEIDML